MFANKIIGCGTQRLCIGFAAGYAGMLGKALCAMAINENLRTGDRSDGVVEKRAGIGRVPEVSFLSCRLAGGHADRIMCSTNKSMQPTPPRGNGR
jgi:hypothetical protein